jgi:hypothetical protein
MNENKDKQRKKNLLVGWSIGIFALALYVFTIFF